jgi:predicted phosphodiesterase
VAERDRIETRRARYERAASLSLEPWLQSASTDSVDSLLRAPLLCFSDTHLVSSETAWSEDAPADLLALIEALPEHRPWSPGDLTESVGLSAAARASLFRCERLEPLWSALVSRGARVVIGNHDVGAERSITERFGAAQVFDGGFDCGAIRVRHGHERSAFETELVRRTGPVVVPMYERARRALRRPAERLSNERVLERVREGAPFVLFGHSHRAEVRAQDPARAWANPGCFLRSVQSFITIEGRALSLYRRR